MEIGGVEAGAAHCGADGDQESCAPDWFYAALAHEPRRSLVEYEGASIEVLEWGDPQASGIHLLHGFRAHASWWAHIAPFLADRYHVVASSWSGMGRSQWRPAYSLAQYAREAMAVAEATGLTAQSRRPMMAAHSLGGHVGVQIAAESGARLCGMLLLDVGLTPKKKKPPIDPPRRVYADKVAQVERFRLTPQQEAHDFIVRHIAEESLVPASDGEGWEWSFDPHISAKLERPNHWDMIAQAQCPTAWVRGERSRVVPDWLVELQRPHVQPGTPIITLPLAGHHLMLDHPLQLVATLRNFAEVWG